jgi:hypothetical protein
MTEIEKTSSLDEIVSIEDVGEIDTYDFTIPVTHCFYANDVLVHNSGSIEEKADCCLMLHYPYFYDKTEDMNELQVIVAKNRYGATGHAKLYVHPQYSRISDDGSVHKGERVELDVAGSNREPSKESPVHSTSVQLPMDKGQAPAVSAWSGTKEEWEA